MTPLVTRQDTGAVARLVLSDPGRFNALSEAMIAELSAALSGLGEGVRVVVLAAEGRAFCAGHDLKEMQAMRAAPDKGAAGFARLFGACGALMQQIVALPQPVIAEVQGVATAAGCQLVASCDLAVAAEGAKFGVNGINIGLFCATPAVALTRAVPHKAAFELLTTGGFLSAARAEALGLVNRVVPPEALTEATMGLAQTLAAKLPAALRMGKALVAQQRGLPLAEAYQAASEVMCANMLLPETDEGISAFLEKRPPRW